MIPEVLGKMPKKMHGHKSRGMPGRMGVNPNKVVKKARGRGQGPRKQRMAQDHRRKLQNVKVVSSMRK